MRLTKHIFTISCLFALASASNAAHWVLVSLADTNFPAPPYVSDSFVTRVLTTRQFDAAIPTHSTMIYGSGTFKFYGEQSHMKPEYNGGPGTFADQNYLNSYYEFKFKWVSDSPSDVPPSVTTSVEAFGYNLEKVDSSFFYHAIWGGPWTIGINSIHHGFPVYGPTWSVPGQTGYGTMPPGDNLHWPQSGGLDITITFPGIGLMYVRPQTIGGGTLAYVNGDLIATINVLNSMEQNFSIPISSPGGGITVGAYLESTFSCYKSVTRMLGLPVVY